MGENMNILITGSGGFIGKHFWEKFYRMGHHIDGYDLMGGQDIRNLHDLDKAFEISQCDTVIHLAAHAGVRRGNEYAHEYLSTNIEGTWNVGKMCEKYGCRLISFSSSSVYGNAHPPTKEDDLKKPISLYGITKLCGEHIVNEAKIDTTIIRPFTVYGMNGRGDQVFYKWINQYCSGKPATVFGDGFNKRGYTYVDDIVGFVETLINSKWTWQHQDFNLGGSEVIATKDMIEIFQHCLPSIKFVYLPQPDIDIAENYADISKAKMFGFDPPKNFNQNLANIIRKELEL